MNKKLTLQLLFLLLPFLSFAKAEKKVYRDPCHEISTAIIKNGIERSQDVMIRLALPLACPATEDLIILVTLADPLSNQSDFTLPVQVILRSGRTSVDLVIPVIDDNVMEHAESFQLSFSLPNNSPYQFTSDQAVREFTIEDDDMEDVVMIDFPPAIEEGSSGKIIMTIPNGKMSPVDISFQLDIFREEFGADNTVDFTIEPFILPAFTNSVEITVDVLNDDLIEGEESFTGALPLNPNEFSNNFRAEAGILKKLTILDADNTFENRVFYLSSNINNLNEGSEIIYTFTLGRPLKLQRQVDIKTNPFSALPAYVSQTTASMTYTESPTAFTIRHLEDQVLNTAPSIILNLSARDAHTGNYRFFWRDEFTDQMEIFLTDNDQKDDIEPIAANRRIPNTFSPNGDGINDIWDLTAVTEGNSNCEVVIYSRTGIRVFKSSGYQTPWDGRYAGAKLPAGVYFFKITAGDKLYSGNINVLR